MKTENYSIQYRYVPGALYARDLAAAKAAGNAQEVAELEACGDSGYGALNNGAIMVEAFRYRKTAEKRLAALEADPCIQWVSPSGKLATSPMSSYGYNPGETKLPHSFE